MNAKEKREAKQAEKIENDRLEAIAETDAQESIGSVIPTVKQVIDSAVIVEDYLPEDDVAVADPEDDDDDFDMTEDEVRDLLARFRKKNRAAADKLTTEAVEASKQNFQQDHDDLRAQQEEILRVPMVEVERLVDEYRVVVMAEQLEPVKDALDTVLASIKSLKELAETTGVKIKDGNVKQGSSDLAYRKWIEYTSEKYVEWLISNNATLHGSKTWADIGKMWRDVNNGGKPFPLGPIGKNGQRQLDHSEKGHRYMWMTFKSVDQLKGRLDAYNESKPAKKSS